MTRGSANDLWTLHRRDERTQTGRRNGRHRQWTVETD